MSMPSGEYYVGDLCYVLHDRWDELCDITIQDHKVLNGEFTFADGTRFAIFTTMYGDGCYEDQFGNQYPVDAGLIGCILLKDISKEERENIKSGHVHIFTQYFTPIEEDGVIVFHKIRIDTKDSVRYNREVPNEDDWGQY
jgi:hypothetical protein